MNAKICKRDGCRVHRGETCPTGNIDPRNCKEMLGGIADIQMGEGSLTQNDGMRTPQYNLIDEGNKMSQGEKEAKLQADIESLRQLVDPFDSDNQNAIENLIGALSDARAAAGNVTPVIHASEEHLNSDMDQDFWRAWPTILNGGGSGGWLRIAKTAWIMSRQALQSKEDGYSFASQGMEPDSAAYDKAESAQSLEIAWESVCDAGHSGGDRELFAKAWHMSRQAWGKSEAPAPIAPQPSAPIDFERYRLDLARELFLKGEITSCSPEVSIKNYAEVCALAANELAQRIAKLDKLP